MDTQKRLRMITCLTCNKEFKVYPYEIKNNRRYCSKICALPPMFINCKYCAKEFRISPSRANGVRKYCSKDCANKDSIGKPGYWTGKKRPGLLTTTSFKAGLVPWNKGLEWIDMRGNKSPRWVGGKIKHPDKRIRKSPEYIAWRTAVFQRDNFTCQICNIRGGELQADHIKPFALYPELRLEIDNGRTLCLSCHKKTDTYGRSSMYLIAKEVMPL